MYALLPAIRRSGESPSVSTLSKGQRIIVSSSQLTSNEAFVNHNDNKQLGLLTPTAQHAACET